MLVFDTFTYVEKLKKVGSKEEQPEMQIDLFRTLLENELAGNRIVPMYKLTLWNYVKKPNNISNTPAKKPNWVNHRALQIERETLPKPKRTP